MEQVRHGHDVKTLSGAWAQLWTNRSPRVIAAGIALLVVLRIVLGAFTWRDAVAAGAVVGIYPFGEWAIHVYLLHLKPFRWRGRRVELPTAQAHREHHEQPDDLGLILLAPLEALALIGLAVPAAGGIVSLTFLIAGGSLPPAAFVSAWLAGTILVGIYEWTHFLIHTAHRPQSRYYRQIWRTHRLHHFKNEHYWHGITNTLGDRVFGTFPEHADVERSRTARTLSEH